MPYHQVSIDRGWDPVDLYYELHGKGSQKVLFIMGFLSPCRHWDQQVDFFEKLEEYQVCIFDNRGAGKSSVPRTNYRTSDMAQDALELVDHLGWEKFHLVGLSMGGMIAMELSLLSPHRILSLVLAVTHAGAVAPLSGALAIIKSGAYIGALQKAKIVVPVLYSKEFLEREHKDGGTMISNIIQRFSTHREGKDPHPYAIAGHLRAVVTHSVSANRLEKLKEAAFPILILTGTVDNMVRPSESRKLHSMLGVSEFLEFEGAGHLINEECADKFNQLCLQNFKKGDPTISKGLI